MGRVVKRMTRETPSSSDGSSRSHSMSSSRSRGWLQLRPQHPVCLVCPAWRGAENRDGRWRPACGLGSRQPQARKLVRLHEYWFIEPSKNLSGCPFCHANPRTRGEPWSQPPGIPARDSARAKNSFAN